MPLPKLVRHVTKLGRNVKPAEITDILQRLKALDAQRGTIPLPKGPVPTSHEGHARRSSAAADRSTRWSLRKSAPRPPGDRVRPALPSGGQARATGERLDSPPG